MRLNEAQRTALQAVEDAHARKMQRKVELRREVEAQLQKKLAALDVDEGKAAARALALGVPKSRIGRALGTTVWARIDDIVSLGEDPGESEKRASLPFLRHIEITDAGYVFTHDGESIEYPDRSDVEGGEKPAEDRVSRELFRLIDNNRSTIMETVEILRAEAGLPSYASLRMAEFAGGVTMLGEGRPHDTAARRRVGI